ncbi:putative MFS family arabinose efflux permease [Microcella alkaliphila]|uniref:Putative MFS family arabinose efflux permease n=1 Tax=Microcella alkaliphila TaxID=279828 RepID=A0A4Q7TGC1_9MICO|nr:MFS transporter [Microcella alkaliphila]RZT59511.1 putative MFS family arabinose efflux permease [Microcella alkaliphila]
MFRSLAGVNYRIWFAGALISNIGAWMQRTAQDWYVLTELTDNDAVAVGITMALQFGPALLISPYAGILADRINGRRLLAATQITLALLALGLGAIIVAGVAELWMVYLFALGLGITTAIDAPARQTFVGELVGTKDLPNAVALNSASFNTARLIGPAVAGLLTVAVGAGWVIVINAVTFLAMLVALYLLRENELHPMKKEAKARGQFRAGLAYVRRRGDLMAIFAMVFLMGTFGFNFAIFTATMASVEFGRGAGEFGLMSSIVAVGSVIGALGSARRDRPRLRVIVGSALGFSAAMVVAALMPTFPLFLLALAPIGFFALTMITSANAYVQTTTRPAIRGRVMSLYLMIFMGGTPLGGPLLGLIANEFGPRWAIAVGALAGIAAATVAVIWMRATRNLRIRRSGGRQRWYRPRLLLRYDGDKYDRETATQEIAIVEAESRRI